MVTKQKLAEKYHFIGIGGVGMSGLARLLRQRSIVVSGSDLAKSPILEQLEKMGASIFVGHQQQHVPEKAHIVVTSQVTQDNPEWLQAKALQLPVLHRSDLLKLLMDEKRSLLVAGTHGKTTTTALLTHVLKEAGLDPSYSVGGILLNNGLNADHGFGEFFIAEADESDGTFLKYHPNGAIITNIDDDHLDHYQSTENVKVAFEQFIGQVKIDELLFLYGDDPKLVQIKRGIHYGFSANCPLRILDYTARGNVFLLNILFEGKVYQDVEVNLMGRHNALNALAVFGMALKLKIPEKTIRRALQSFKGVKRRSEKIAELKDVLILDDYGHHPVEIAATLKAVKHAYPDRRLVVLFQPHRYSRTRDCLTQFGTCFDEADYLLITDIYAAMEPPIPGIDAHKIIHEVHKQSTVPCNYVEKVKSAEAILNELHYFDIVLIMGAGDITKEAPHLAKLLEKKDPHRFKCAAIFGGKSTEHEISLLSAANVFLGIDKTKYEVNYFYISKQGKWIFGQEAEERLTTKASSEPVTDQLIESIKQLQRVDFALPMLHGTFGEDGTIQGLFEILNVAYVGSNYLASAIAMDKSLTKRLAESHGLKVAPYLEIKLHEWQKKEESTLQLIQERFNYPLYVKPVRLGSTIGVSRVENGESLKQAIQNAFQLDDLILIEQAIKGREIEFAVFGNEKITVLPPGEIFNIGRMYDYQSKYGQAKFITSANAVIDKSILQNGLSFAKRAYESIGCDGYARVDCFLEESTNEFILNEINPIPGFTNSSLYPQICALNGISLSDLVDQFARLALKRGRRAQRKIYDKNNL